MLHDKVLDRVVCDGHLRTQSDRLSQAVQRIASCLSHCKMQIQKYQLVLCVNLCKRSILQATIFIEPSVHYVVDHSVSASMQEVIIITIY